MGYSGILVIHICGGIAAILSGFTALFAGKGSRLHRNSGNVFCISMIFMAVGAALLGYVHPKGDTGDIISGLLTMYLIATAWMTVKRKAGETGLFEILACAAAVIGAVFILLYTVYTVRNGTAFKNGYPGYIFGGIILLAGVLDLRLILHGGLYGVQRLARHLWRMSFALFIAAGSFFFGQMQVFPGFVRDTNMLFVLAFLPLILLVYWLFRVLFAKNHRMSSGNPESLAVKISSGAR